MNKRETVLNLLNPDIKQTYIPAGFFIHFDESCHKGPAAVDKHLEFFRYTGMDFVKIQYEDTFPHIPSIKTPNDWTKIPYLKKDFFQNQLAILKGLLKQAQKEALVIMTVYSPFMCAGHTAGKEMLLDHIRQDPDKVNKGMEIITDSLLLFVRECIKLGIDGFYASTQGGESNRLGGTHLFEQCVKPYDLAVMEEMNQHCQFNILHVCDYHAGYDDLTPFLEYPGHVINANLRVGAEMMTPIQLSNMFQRPFMGGLERKQVIAQGNQEEVTQAVKAVLENASEKFILGADCTLPNDVNWDNIKTAIDTAHAHSK